MVLSSRRPGRNSKLQQIPLSEILRQGSFLFQAEGLALFRAKGSIPIGRGGHARAFFTLGTKTKITGSNLFMRLNYWVVYCGGSIMQNPPTLAGIEAPAAATIVLSSTAFTFKLDSVPASVANLKLVICASDPQSNGISRAYSKAAAFDAPCDPVATAIDIKEKYEAKYGTVSAGNPKVFFKYFYVNTATGEKSGEMLAVAKFAATNGQPEPENQNPGGQPEGGNQGGGEGGDENPGQGLGF